MFLDSTAPPAQLGLFQSVTCRLPGNMKVCRRYTIPLSAVLDRNLLFKLLEKLYNHNSSFIVHVAGWTEADGYLLVYTDSAADTPLEAIYCETRFMDNTLPEHVVWEFMYSMLSAVKEAQAIRNYILSDSIQLQNLVPILSLKSFYISNAGLCKLDVLMYCFNYLFDRTALFQNSSDQPLILSSITAADLWPYKDCSDNYMLYDTISPPLGFYMEPEHRSACPTNKTDWLKMETYMIGRIVLLLCDLRPAVLAITDEDDEYYNTNNLYFQGYSVELALIGYRMLYTQRSVRFLVSDLLEHDSMIVLQYILFPPSRDVTHHRIGSQSATPLMLGARSRFPLFIDELVERYAGMQDSRGKTALMYAAENNSLAYIECLKAKEMRIQLRTIGTESDGETALMIAVANGDCNAAALLMDEAGLARRDGTTALMMACKQIGLQYDIVIDELIAREHGMRSCSGYTALMHAAKAENIRLVRKVMPYEARIQANDGTTALLIAASLGYASICSLLIEQEGMHSDNEGCTALIVASKQGLEKAVLATMQLAGESNHMGRTALMHAVKYNRQRIASILSTCEKEMGKTDRYGASALSMAAESGNAQMLSILLGSPIADRETSLVDKNGWTALIHAARNNHVDCVDQLVKIQAGVKDLKGYSAILYAIKWGHVEVVKRLLESEGHLLKEQPGKSHLQAIDTFPDMANLLAS
ncbi:Protein 21.1 [Giardia lamblia P15]|uniref:Protein 21.1 n=1 Tax=Giardia intestinalis (strain P15) TaxID=658858 RepID=E1F5Q5_GIAIA|nr:Protein 21.1 [Giardia lamblia P15]